MIELRPHERDVLLALVGDRVGLLDRLLVDPEWNTESKRSERELLRDISRQLGGSPPCLATTGDAARVVADLRFRARGGLEFHAIGASARRSMGVDAFDDAYVDDQLATLSVCDTVLSRLLNAHQRDRGS